VVALGFAWRGWPPGIPAAGKSAATTPVATGKAAFPHDPELKRALTLIDSLEATREDFRLADEITARVADRSPTDPEAVTMRARVHAAFVTRNFDFSAERTAQAKRFCERAVQLAPDSPDAHYALSLFLYDRAGDFVRAETDARRACELAPDDPRFQRQLFRAATRVRPEEGVTLAEDLVRRFPRDALAHYDVSIFYRNRREWDKFERELDATLAIAPIPNAINWKSRAALLRGDIGEMRQWLDRVPPRLRSEERTVISSIIYSSLSGDYEYGLAALRAFAEPWFFDAFYYAGPAALPQATLLEQQGKTGLARAQYEEAMAALTRHHQEQPDDQTTRLAEIWTLRGLGRLDEARASNRTALETLRRPYRVSGLAVWWLDVIPCCLLLGEHATAVQLIREAAAERDGRRTILHRMKADARMAPFRDDPEIVALLAEPKPEASIALSPARELAVKALALFRALEATREDFALAEDYCQRALKLDSTDGDVWAIYSELNSAFGYRGWDTSPQRREQTRVTAERAIRLAPTSPEAKVAQAGAWSTFGINRAETEKLLREVLEERPNDQATLKFLAVTVLNRGGLDECLALNERSAALPGGDPLALFNNARYLWQRDRSAEAYATIQRSIAQQPFPSALVLKTMMEANWRGDLAAAEATLKQIPQSAMLEDRANLVAGMVGYYQRRADVALAAWGAFPRDYYNDFVFDGPKGLLIGLADALDHRDAAAKIEWRTALQVVEKRIAATPNNAAPYWYKAYLLACLGEKAAAEETLNTYEQLAGIKFTAGSPMSFNAALLYTRLGRLDEVFSHPSTAEVARLRLDPRLDSLRADPRFERYIEGIRRQAAAPKP
jgi:tetratricopeptide (TPR) repeat protein